jgi:hypothetical protein
MSHLTQVDGSAAQAVASHGGRVRLAPRHLVAAGAGSRDVQVAEAVKQAAPVLLRGLIRCSRWRGGDQADTGVCQ